MTLKLRSQVARPKKPIVPRQVKRRRRQGEACGGLLLTTPTLPTPTRVHPALNILLTTLHTPLAITAALTTAHYGSELYI